MVRHALYCGVVYASSLTLGGRGVVLVSVVRTSGGRDRSDRSLGMERQAPWYLA